MENHLSAPIGSSTNDFIDPSAYTLNYCTVDDAYAIVNKRGPGTLLSKINLKNAFRLFPVRPADWNLLAIYWCGNYCVDTCLLFGLRSTPATLIASHLQSIGFYKIIIMSSTSFNIWMIFLRQDHQDPLNVNKTLTLCSSYTTA